MSTPMPRCSCGCGESLNAGDYGEVVAAFNLGCSEELTWSSSTCLKLRRARLRKEKPVDGEAVSVTKGLVPAPRKQPVHKKNWKGAKKQVVCDKCGQLRMCRSYSLGTDQSLLLCAECAP